MTGAFSHRRFRPHETRPQPPPAGGGGGGGGGGSDALLHGIENSLRHSLGIRQDVVVPESQDVIALSLQPARTLFIVRDLLRMLTTLHFDDYPAFETDKIHDERANRLLAA